jgi:iron complex outermembrane receptor protein
MLREKLMINNRCLILFFFALITFNQTSFAEDNSAQIVSEDDYIGDVPRVLTVSRLSQSMADAPSAVTVIDRETIRASGIVDLPEIFRLVPGFYVGTNAGFVHNTNHVVSYHGLTTAYSGAMQVLINGRSIYSPLYGGVQWSELPLAIADIERIEINRGPNAASYGANSFFGVINIITQNPSDQLGASVSVTYGNGRREAFTRYADKQANLSYRVTAGYRDDDGLDNRYDFKRTRLINTQASYRVNDKNDLEFEFGLVNGDRDDDQSLGTTRYFQPRVRGIENNYELIRWRRNISDNSDLSLQAYHSFDKTNDVVNSVNLRPLIEELLLPRVGPVIAAAIAASLAQDTVRVNNDIEMERYDIEAQHNFLLFPSLRGVWGASVRQDIMYAPYYLGTNNADTFNLQRLFGHVEWSPSHRVVLNAGAMVENNSFTATNSSPRASINFKLNTNHTVRFGISTALRTPNYLEDKFNTSVVLPTSSSPALLAQYFADTPNLKPERIISREIGYLGDFGKFSLDTRFFYDDIHDYIKSSINTSFVAPSGFVLIKQPRLFANAGDVNVKGIEAQAKWRITNDTRLLLNYAYVNIDGDEKQTANNITMAMPRDTISALLTHRLNPQWDASLAYYQTSEVAALGDGGLVGSAQRTDVRLARKFMAEHFSGEVSVVVENLFNEHYQEFAEYNTLKRRARLNVRLDF